MRRHPQHEVREVPRGIEMGHVHARSTREWSWICDVCGQGGDDATTRQQASTFLRTHWRGHWRSDR